MGAVSGLVAIVVNNSGAKSALGILPYKIRSLIEGNKSNSMKVCADRLKLRNKAASPSLERPPPDTGRPAKIIIRIGN